MSESQIQELRSEIDDLNMQILNLLSRRGQVAKEIGTLQTGLGSSQRD